MSSSMMLSIWCLSEVPRRPSCTEGVTSEVVMYSPLSKVECQAPESELNMLQVD